MNKHRTNRHSSHPAKSLIGLGLILPLGSLGLHAASATWDGGAATNVLNTAANWTGDVAPSAALDTATWDGSVVGDLSLVWSGNLGPASGNAGGININVAGTNTGALQLDSTSGNLGLGDITIASGAGAFTLGDGATAANIVLRDPTTAFTNDSSATATFKSDLAFANGGGVGNRNITFGGSGNWLVEGTLFGVGTFTSAGSAFITKTGAGTLTLGASNANGGTTVINGGAIAITHGSALGTGAVSMGGGTSGRLRVSNDITVANAININGAGAASSTAGALENTSGANTITGAITWSNPGGLFSNIVSQSGTLTLAGNITAGGAVTGGRTLNFGGVGDIVSSGVISNGTATLSLSKTGAGVLTLSGANTYTGTTTISEGTLALGASNVIADSSNIVLNGGALSSGIFTDTLGTLDLDASSSIVLGSGGVFSFADSSAIDWGFNTLSITGTFVDGASIRFGTSDSALTSSQLLLITINGSAAAIDSSGYLTAAIPEPSTFACLAGLGGLAFALVRRRVRS